MIFALRAGAALAAVILLNVYAEGAGVTGNCGRQQRAEEGRHLNRIDFACGMAEHRPTFYICPMA